MSEINGFNSAYEFSPTNLVPVVSLLFPCLFSPRYILRRTELNAYHEYTSNSRAVEPSFNREVF